MSEDENREKQQKQIQMIKVEKIDDNNEKNERRNCKHCRIRSEPFTLTSWHEHLLSENHQQIKRKLSYVSIGLFKWHPESSLIINNFKGVDLKPTELLTYFSRFGDIEDFFLFKKESEGRTQIRRAYISMTYQSSIDEILQRSQHFVRLVTFTVELFSKLPELEDYLAIKEPTTPTPDPETADSSLPKENKRLKMDQIPQRSFFVISNMKLPEQLENLRNQIGWSQDYLNESVKYIDSTLGQLNVQFRKYPVGDLITRMGLITRSLLEILVDVEELEGNKSSESINTLIEGYKSILMGPSLSTRCFKIQSIKNGLSYKGLIPGIPFESTIQIKIGNSMPLHECKLFKFYCDLDVRIEILGRLLTFWAETLNIFQNSEQHYSSQCILLLLIFFLQHRKIIPPVEALQKADSDNPTPHIVAGKTVSFCSDLKIIRPNKLGLLEDKSIRAMSSLGLLKDCFEFYGVIDFDKNALSLRFGSLEEKKYLESTLCVKNPFDQKLNATSIFTLDEVKEFQKHSKISAEIVCSILTSDTPDLTVFLSETCKLASEQKCKKSSVTCHNRKIKHENPPSSLTQPDAEPHSSTKYFQPQHQNFNLPENNVPSSGEEHEYEKAQSDLSAECTLTLNENLYRYFERAMKGISPDVKFKKMQILILQYIMEYNEKFWTNCLGMTYETMSGEPFSLEEFAKLKYNGQHKSSETVAHRISKISEYRSHINIEFRTKSDGEKLHKLFNSPTESKSSKRYLSGPTLTEFSLLLYEEVPPERLQQCRDSAFVANSHNQKIVFACSLLGGIDPCYAKTVPLSTLSISLVGPNANSTDNLATIRLVKAIYRKLGMSYITKMIKRWLSEGSDFDEDKAVNFVASRNQKWNRKASKKRKWLQKKAQRHK